MQSIKKLATAIVIGAGIIAILFFNVLQLVPPFLNAKKGWDYLFGEKRELSLDERVARIVAEEQKDVPYSDSLGTFIKVRREGFNIRRYVRLNLELPANYDFDPA